MNFHLYIPDVLVPDPEVHASYRQTLYPRFQEHSTHNNYNYADEVRHAIPLFFLLYPYFFDCLRQKYMFIFEYLYFCEKLKDYAH